MTRQEIIDQRIRKISGKGNEPFGGYWRESAGFTLQRVIQSI